MIFQVIEDGGASLNREIANRSGFAWTTLK
jgi:hypothetical protein